MGKISFDYYSIDTNRYQDIKIKRLKKELGCAGVAVYDYILCEIYRVKGCFLEWDNNTAFDVAEYFGLKENLICEIVNYCCKVGLFDKGMLARENVITSHSIQSRFLKWSDLAKRKDVKIPEKYIAIPEQTLKITEYFDKEEKRKVDERKENEREFDHDPDFEKLILSFFGFNEINHFKNFKKFRECCAAIFFADQFDYFKIQGENYKKYIELIGVRYQCNFDNFLGKQENKFEDGVWCKENWEKKIADRQVANLISNKGATAVVTTFSQNKMNQT